MYPTSARFRQVMMGSHRRIVRARIMSGIQFGANPTGGLELPLRSGDVKMNSTNDVKATLDCEVPGDYWDALRPYGAEIFVERGVDYGDGSPPEYVPLGYFRIKKLDQAKAPDGPIKVSAQDRISHLKKVRLIYPYQYPGGLSHAELFNRMVNGYTNPTGYNGGPLVISYGMYFKADVPIVFEGYDGTKAYLPAGMVEDDIYEWMTDVVDARGCVVRFDRLGQLVIEKRDRDPSTPAIYAVKPGQDGNLLSASRSLSDDGVYNIIVARGSDPAKAVGYRLAYNDDEDSLLYWQGPFGPIPRHYASPLLENSAQAQQAANTLLSRYTGLPSGLATAVLPDPSLDPLDPITVQIGSDVQDHLIDELTIPLVGNDSGVEIVTRSKNEVPTDEDSGGPEEPGTGGEGEGGGTDPGTGGAPIYPAKFRDGVDFPWFTEPASNQAVPVANTSELTSKWASAAPGQTLVLASGTYNPGILTSTKKAAKTQPIVVKAATPGGVKFASGSGFSLRGEYILVKDIDKEFDDSGKSFAFEGAAKFCGYDGVIVGPTSLGAPQATAAKSLHFYAGGTASDCFITFCETRNKSKPGNGVLVDGDFSTNKACRHILIDHVYFHDYGTEVVNDFEAIRYGVSTMQTTVVDAAIIRCVFERIKTEPEIISLKACGIESWGHTVRECVGSLSIRHGDDNFHQDFYMFGSTTGANGTKSGGARVYGKRNKIRYGYMQDLNGSSYESTMTIDGGDTSSPTNGHQNVVGGTFADCLAVNCATGVVLGEHYATAPSGITVKGWRLVNSGGTAVRQVKAPTGSNDITDNIHYPTLAAAQAAGMTGPTGGAYRFPNIGPRLVKLEAADVGRSGTRADGTGPSLGGAGGGTGTGVPAVVQAAQAILDRKRAGLAINPDWTWTGAPAVVTTQAPNIRTKYATEGSPADELTWLQNFISSNGQSGLGSIGGATTIAGLLKLGAGPGLAKFDIGIGFAPGDDRGPTGDGTNKVTGKIHRNYSLATIVNGLTVPGYFELTDDRTAVRESAHLDGGTTSAKTEYARVEPREYDIDGTTKMAFDPNRGIHYIIHRWAVDRMPPDKPELCVVQWHDAEDDVAMVRYRNKTTVEAKLGDTVLGNLTTSASFGTIYTSMIKIVEGTGDNAGKCRLEYYWQDMTSPKFTTGFAKRSVGWYGKAGAYGQSNETIDAVEDGPFIIRTFGLGHWHSQSPKSPNAAWPEPLGLKP